MLLAVLAVVAAAGSAPFTLDQVTSAPFPTGLVAAQGHPRVAWVMNARGTRNVWVAEGPLYQGRALTTFAGDEGEEVAELAFTADARSVVFVRGDGPNRAGEIPNPRSRTEPRERAVHVVTLAGATRRLAEGHSPLPHPRENRIVFIDKNQVFALDLAEGSKPERLFAARGGLGSLRFSADGASLAFVSDRGDHAFVGVYDVAAKSIRWLDPGVDRDGEPAFSPDGKSIAFLRLPAQKDRFVFGAEREGEPWSIRVAELASGRSREVFRADRGPGSVYSAVEAPNQVLWTKGDRLVFPWEKTGWRHLYSVPAAGGPPVALTAGEFEVEYIAQGASGTSVVYSSNANDIDRRHLWTVPGGGGAATPVTTGTGIEWSPVVTNDGALAFVRSSGTRPAHPAIKFGSEAAREMAKHAIPVDFPSAALVEPEAVSFAASDGQSVPAQLFRPRDLAAGQRRPAVVFFHGGSRRQMLLGFHYMGYYHHAYAMNQYLAGLGYVVLSVNYRSGTGYGLQFREALSYGPSGASEYADVVGAGRYLKSRTDVDPRAIGLWGGSYGGYLTALGLARNSDLFAAGVDIHGCHDWNVVIQNFQPVYEPLRVPDAAKRAFEASPMASVASWRSPVLLVHGDDDRNVPFSETVTLAEALRKQGVPFETLVLPDDVHSFLLHASWLETFERSASFLDRHLRGRR